jgi:hypothetical protein
MLAAGADGFVSPRKIPRLTGAGEDDLKALISKHFVIWRHRHKPLVTRQPSAQ